MELSLSALVRYSRVPGTGAGSGGFALLCVLAEAPGDTAAQSPSQPATGHQVKQKAGSSFRPFEESRRSFCDARFRALAGLGFCFTDLQTASHSKSRATKNPLGAPCGFALLLRGEAFPKDNEF